MNLDLDGMHAGYRGQVEEIIGDLMRRYPWTPLRMVRLYEPTAEDRSLGVAHQNGDIRLNAYWFSRDPALLQKASNEAGREANWHGPMVREPAHVLTHEFGHVVTHALPGWQTWADEQWRQATANPERAPTLYSLATPDEYFGESFAMMDLGYGEEPGLLELLRSR